MSPADRFVSMVGLLALKRDLQGAGRCDLETMLMMVGDTHPNDIIGLSTWELATDLVRWFYSPLPNTPAPGDVQTFLGRQSARRATPPDAPPAGD